MKTNKTPIQELIDYMHNHRMDMREEYGLIFVTLRDVEIMIEKEKKFAFDFYTQGQCDWDNPEDNSFEKFYSQYVSQHNK